MLRHPSRKPAPEHCWPQTGATDTLTKQPRYQRKGPLIFVTLWQSLIGPPRAQTSLESSENGYALFVHPAWWSYFFFCIFPFSSSFVCPLIQNLYPAIWWKSKAKLISGYLLVSPSYDQDWHARWQLHPSPSMVDESTPNKSDIALRRKGEPHICKKREGGRESKRAWERSFEWCQYCFSGWGDDDGSWDEYHYHHNYLHHKYQITSIYTQECSFKILFKYF